MRAVLALLAAGGLSALLLGCGGETEVDLAPIFQAPTWSDGERLSYQLRERDDIRGSCVLEVLPGSAPGRTGLSSRCASKDGRYRDDRLAEVDSRTLIPLTSERTILDTRENTSTVFTAAYEGGTVRFVALRGDRRNETTRDLPTPAAENTEAAYYDDVALFWLIRGIRLEDGYSGAFRHANAGNGRVFTVEVEVLGSEQVSVPAGIFETWAVRVRTASITQLFWVERAEPHRVIRARIERDLYELLPD